MNHAAALLLAIFTASPSSAGDATVVETWTAVEVAQLAADDAPAARVLESERRAIACGIDRDDPEVCAQAALIQSVYASLVAHQRNDAAAEARTAYWQIVALDRQLELLKNAAPLLDSLESLAEAAERLGFPDGDPSELAEQRLVLEDRWFEADFARRRLRNQLARLTGTRIDRAQTVTLVDSMPQAEEEWDAEREVAIALTHRSDLQALETLCRCTNENTLPAVRDLLGVISPGIGLAGRATPQLRMLMLHAPRPSTADLGCRKFQCHELLEERREQIRFEVRDALLQIEAATAREGVARRRVELATTTADRAARAEELDQQSPGSETTARLEVLERRAELVERQLAVVEAIVTLHKSQGIAEKASAATR